MLDIIASYHCIQFQGNLMNQPWENDQKPSFGPNFGPTLVPPKLFCGFYAFYALLQANIVCNFKQN